MNMPNRKSSMLAVTILGLGLLLGLGQTFAETLYRVSPKIAPRTRESAPVLSPFVASPVVAPATAPKPSAPSIDAAAKMPTAPRIEVEPSHEIPVSYRPQITPVEKPTAKPSSPSKNSVKPTTSKKNRARSNHPVVHPPEPLLPDSPESAVPDKTGKLSGAVLETVDLRAMADETLLAKASANAQKPAVNFPEQLEPSTHEHSTSSAKPDERHIHPVNYQPYIGRITQQRQQDLETAIGHYNRAAYYEQRNKLDDAINEYKQALLLNSKFADAYVGLSTAFIRKNDWENVMESLQKALAMKQRFMEPSNIVQAWYNLSTAHCVADNYSPARRYYQKVKLAGHPNQEQLWEFIQKNCKP